MSNSPISECNSPQRAACIVHPITICPWKLYNWKVLIPLEMEVKTDSFQYNHSPDIYNQKPFTLCWDENQLK